MDEQDWVPGFGNGFIFALALYLANEDEAAELSALLEREDVGDGGGDAVKHDI